jgi:hypothetical protein
VSVWGVEKQVEASARRKHYRTEGRNRAWRRMTASVRPSAALLPLSHIDAAVCYLLDRAASYAGLPSTVLQGLSRCNTALHPFFDLTSLLTCDHACISHLLRRAGFPGPDLSRVCKMGEVYSWQEQGPGFRRWASHRTVQPLRGLLRACDYRPSLCKSADTMTASTKSPDMSRDSVLL